MLDSQFVFFIYDNGRVMRWPKFTVWQDERYDELLEPVADAGAGAGNLVLSGDNLMWFGDGQVYSVAKGCLLDGCARRSLAAETGDRLDGAVLSGPNAGTTTNPLWVTNRKMRGVRCAFVSAFIAAAVSMAAGREATPGACGPVGPSPLGAAWRSMGVRAWALGLPLTEKNMRELIH